MLIMSLPRSKINECLLSFIHLERATADSISSQINSSLVDAPLCLDTKTICGQAYDGASIMSSSKAGVQAKIKEVSPRALYTHCYAHCLNHSIATCSNIQEVRNMIGIINESHSFLSNSPKRQRMFDVTVKKLMPKHHILSYLVYVRHVGWSVILVLKFF